MERKIKKNQDWSATDFPIQRIGADGPTIYTHGYANVTGPSHVSTNLRKHLDSKSGQRIEWSPKDAHHVFSGGSGSDRLAT
jgi:hypothetical protein